MSFRTIIAIGCSPLGEVRTAGRVGLVNTWRPRQNGRHFPDDIFKCIFFNENVWILLKISLKFVPKGPINKIPALVQIMAWRRPGDKPLSEPMMVSLLTHKCVTRPQWVNTICAEMFWGKAKLPLHFSIISRHWDYPNFFNPSSPTVSILASDDQWPVLLRKLTHD